MFDREKAGKAVVKLIKETIDDRLKWSVVSQKLNMLESKVGLVVGRVYTTAYRENSFRLYQYQPVQHEYSYVSFTTKKRKQEVIIRLELLESTSEEALWTFPPDTVGLSDLYNTVRLKTTNIDKILDDILADD
ncbi:hypothetical protein [Tunicatimonas pelagia]|uniref:hypothetical protein n=1 Tax=Tunicatimonas pelagia TaxID=931531 RepID=UPI00266552DE|nr:hypothetical protein [Tunicatimonas pelagia]WKN43798.1 hypothetical protein P0M28_02285 [Tunicatimonas pelagia]